MLPEKHSSLLFMPPLPAPPPLPCPTLLFPNNCTLPYSTLFFYLILSNCFLIYLVLPYLTMSPPSSPLPYASLFLPYTLPTVTKPTLPLLTQPCSSLLCFCFALLPCPSSLCSLHVHTIRPISTLPPPLSLPPRTKFD